ncbi:MAG: hypothetical protein EP332_06770 [Bacteroidetes bacterium]|nr:MAG: hypothetical protein EP332_06770 [Bacteroidota bacterium]
MHKERKFLFLFFGVALFFFAWLAFNSTRLAGGEDGVQHYLIARYAVQHPGNLLDHWGKPLFTLFAMPFAQFGMLGVQFLNILLGLLSAYLVYLSAKELGLKQAWLGPLFLLCSPLYLYSLPSAITEVLFSTVGIGAFYLALKQRYTASAILISFIPYARTEGNIIMLMFFVGFVYGRAFRAIPFLITGTLIYSLAGYFYFDDFLWIWHQNPYNNSASAIYGSGPFLHYFQSGREIWGKGLMWLWGIGTVVFTWVMLRKLKLKQSWTKPEGLLLWMVFGSFFAYLFGHSYVWWKGLSASLGLIRVMAGTMPFAVLIALYGVHVVLAYLNPRLQGLKLVLLALATLFVVRTGMQNLHMPFTGDREREAMLDVGRWYKSSRHYREGRKVYYFAPTAAQAFGVDPFNPEERGNLDELRWQRDIPEGSLIVWDAHFGPNECQLPLDTLMARPELMPVYAYMPDSSMETLNKYIYQIQLFIKNTDDH